MREWLDKLKALDPCHEAWKWVLTQNSPQELWDKCDRIDWMMWLLGHTDTDRKISVALACRFARLALPYAKTGAALRCIETIEARLAGTATLEQVGVARAAADAADAADATDRDARKASKQESCNAIRRNITADMIAAGMKEPA